MVDIFSQAYSEIANAVRNLPTAAERARKNLLAENVFLRNTRLKQQIRGDRFEKDMKVQKELWNRHVDDVKLTFGIFEKAFSNPALSEASRENMIGLARMMQSSLTPMESVALAGIGSTRVLSADQMKAQEFDRRFPASRAPTGTDGATLPHSEENNPTWAKFYMQRAERAQKRAIAIYGLEKGKALAPVPALIQTDKENVYAYKNPLTNTMGLMNLSTDVPEGLIKRAINDKRTSLSEIAATGMIPDPDQKAQTMYYNGRGYSVESSYDLRTGKHGIVSTPLGPAPPEKLPTTLRNVMAAFGIKDKDRREKLLTNPAEAGLFDSLQAAMELSNPTEKASAFANIRAQLLQMYPKNGWMPFIAQQAKGDFLNIIPFRKDSFHLKDSGIIWRRTNGTAEFFDANNQKFMAYTTPGGVAVDANGNDVPGSKGKSDGDTIPNVVAAPVRNKTVGEVANAGIKAFIAAVTKGLDPEGAKAVTDAYQEAWNKGKLVKKQDFIDVLETLKETAKITTDQAKRFLDWIMSLPIPGTQVEK